jgi:hypothetical protein
VFGVAFRRQAVVGTVAVVGVVVQNLASGGGMDTELALGIAGLAALCLAPSVFAWRRDTYRIAAFILSVLLTVLGVEAAVTGSPGLLPAALLSWLTLLPAQRPERR